MIGANVILCFALASLANANSSFSLSHCALLPFKTSSFVS